MTDEQRRYIALDYILHVHTEDMEVVLPQFWGEESPTGWDVVVLEDIEAIQDIIQELQEPFKSEHESLRGIVFKQGNPRKRG